MSGPSHEPVTLATFFGVLADPQSYRNLAYLLLSFPLGLAYLVFLVVGLSLGLGLSVVLVGIPILIGVVAACWGLVGLERQLAVWLLGLNLRTPLPYVQAPGTLLARFGAVLRHPLTWRGMVYLVLKFPLGVVSFVLTASLLSITGVLLGAPITYHDWDAAPNLWRIGLWHVDLGHVDTLNAAAVAFLVGTVIAPLSLHLTNALAAFWRWWVGTLLERDALPEVAKKPG